MIEALPDLPPGLLGFRFAGSVTRDDYTEVFLPPTKAALDQGRKIRLVLVIDDDFGWFQPGAFWEDLKFGLGSGVSHHASWERMALVSDVDWIKHALAVFGWLVPGEAQVFPRADQEKATAWAAA